MRISEITPKLLCSKFIQNASKEFSSFFDLLKIVLNSAGFRENKSYSGKISNFLHNFSDLKFSDFLIMYRSKINNHQKYTKQNNFYLWN